MPELPEVETVVRSLNKAILGRKIEDVWSDWGKLIKNPKNFKQFKKEVIGKKIKNVRRRGKNIIIELSENTSLLIHQKMTGHLLVGKWNLQSGTWKPKIKGPLGDPVNRFIHLMFWLSGGLMLALSDLRKFAKAELLSQAELQKELSSLGQEPLGKSFTFKKFKEIFGQRRGKIKQVLMDQTVIAGIGNIYSDEILWEAGINPLRAINSLGNKEFKKIYLAIPKILKKAIELQGDSMSDYRLITGQKGHYQEVQKVYRQEGKPCSRQDGGIIKRIKVGGRSAHFCPVCQKTC
jgi:formamidopyrimidine-DNA glycosylase